MSEPIDVKNICLKRILRNDIFVYLYDRKNFMSLKKKLRKSANTEQQKMRIPSSDTGN